MAESLNKNKPNHSQGDETSTAKNQSVTVSDIEKLFSLMRENEIAELEIEQYKTKIHIVSKGAPAPQQPMMQYMPPMQMMPMQSQQQGHAEYAAAQQSPPPQAPASNTDASAAADSGDGTLPANARTVLSPMVGTFYSSPSPESPSFVNPGDTVNEETVLCIIEAMKLMNEIKAETKGKIVRVLVENGMPVEFNQPLFVLE